jgi:hypothetical protein
MKQELETRTRSAQYAVKRAREIVLHNDEMVEKLQISFGLERELLTESDMLQNDLDSQENIPERVRKTEDFKIVTNSKFKKYFQDIINSIH